MKAALFLQPKTAILSACLLTLASGCSTQDVSGLSSKVFNVRKLGAKGDGKSSDTAAIQKALDDCGRRGGGIVRLPAGTYLSQPIFLRSKTTLQLERGATLQATDEPDHFLKPELKTAPRSSRSFYALVNGNDLSEVVIKGPGTIDGAGARWWVPAEEARRKTSGYTLPRPRMVQLTGCKNVRVENITLANSPSFHLVPADCQDVEIENVTITAPAGSPNTDGIDPSVCRGVRISNCRIDVGDDNIAIKSGKPIPGRPFACEDITVTDCVFLNGHGLSIGSETPGGVRNLTVQRCRFEGTENGLRIKSPRGRGGTVENLKYHDITMTNVDPAIAITCYYPKIPAEDAAQPMTPETPIFRNIEIKNLTASCPREAGVIVGLPESMVTGVTLENVRISAITGLTIRNATGVRLKNVTVSAQTGPPIIVQDANVEGLSQVTER